MRRINKPQCITRSDAQRVPDGDTRPTHVYTPQSSGIYRDEQKNNL